MTSDLFDSRAFRQSRPVLLTSFANRVGNIGLSLVPILLVDRKVSTAEGAFVLSTLKATMLAGTLAGGALSDRIGARELVLAAFALSAAGLGGLPFQGAVALILLFGILATVADSLTNVAQRVLLMDEVDGGHQKEALGWMRTVNNSAQIFSYAVAAAASGFGVAPLMLFDAATSGLAFFVGRGILPKSPSPGVRDRGLGGPAERGVASKRSFFVFSMILLGWSLFYELFMDGVAGRLEALHPGEGLRRFSSMMILNTILCAAFSVRAARYFERSLRAMGWGLALTAAGLATAGWGADSWAWVLAGMLCLTLGELMLGAVGVYTMMRLTPDRDNAGFWYSLGVAIMQCGKIAGAAMAFPLFIHARDLRPVTIFIAAGLPALLAALYSEREAIARHSEPAG